VIGNAAKYTPERGRIEVSAWRDETGSAVIRVRDNGIGIDPAFLPHIFDLFSQAERSLDRSEGGLGIGLTLVKELVELHGGKVALTSAGLGKGADVLLHLPVLRSLEEAAAPERPQAAIDSIPRRVLVVEDNVDTRDTIARFLRMRGNEVRVASDGETALREALWFQPEVCVLDIGLPKLDGYQLASRMRALPGLRAALMIAVTGYGSPADRERARSVGFDQHFLKPASPRAIQEAIDAWNPAPYAWASRSAVSLPSRLPG
jgi:CheY-like chemotaxis protein